MPETSIISLPEIPLVRYAQAQEIVIQDVQETSSPVVVQIEPPVKNCSCVSYARSISPYQPPKVVYAKQIPITSQTPKVGGWVIFDYQPFGHTEIIIDIGDGVIRTEGFNLEPCRILKRVISVDDSHILGYFYE